MAVEISVEQVMAMAPDASSAKSGKDLANPRKWVATGHDDDAAWGLCQGSGSKPYQVKVDLNNASGASCSCPSRKFPCKHGLGLLLIYAGQPQAMTEKTRPDWVQEWMSARVKKAEAKVEKQKKKEEAASDPAEQAKLVAQAAKRLAERHKKVAAGVDELDLWLRDVVRQGFSSLPSGDYEYWDKRATRLVDAQCRGPARMIKDMASLSSSGEGWQARLLERLGRLHFLTEGYRRLDQLSQEVQDELLGSLDPAFRSDKADLLASQPAVADDWVVLGQRIETDEDKIRGQWTWLWGRRSNQPALHLEFKRVPMAMEHSFAIGSAFKAELAFYPSCSPLRAEVKSKEPAVVADRLAAIGYSTLDDALRSYGETHARNPWLELFPLPLLNVTPAPRGDGWMIRDSVGRTLPIVRRFAQGWKLMALSGGRPLTLFGEYDGDAVAPLSVWAEGKLFLLTGPSAA